jgi:hypothetical protein
VYGEDIEAEGEPPVIPTTTTTAPPITPPITPTPTPPPTTVMDLTTTTMP